MASIFNLDRFGFGKKLSVYKGTGPSSYSTGGFDVDTGLSNIDFAIAQIDGGYLAQIDWANSSGGTLKIKVYYFDYDASADGVATEVPATTDLSSNNVTVIAVGEA